MRNLFLFSIAVFFLWSCGGVERKNVSAVQDNIILQQDDGSFMLKLEKAACYSNVSDPSTNTAEWNVRVSRPGRYDVWLSSATRDTFDLNYANSVRVTLLDKEFEVDPAIDKIVRNTKEVTYPYFRADSYIGSFYFSEPGDYNIQLISEKVLSKQQREQSAYLSDNTLLMSVILTPLTR